MSKKIFFTDLDGTLLTDTKEITPLTYQTITDWMNNGNYLALSSGRPIDSIRAVIDSHKLMHDNLYAIGFNGSLIFHPMSGKKLTAKTLSPDTMRIIGNKAKEHGIYCHAYNDTHIIAPYESEELAFYKKTVKIPHIVNPDYPEKLEPSYKILCILIDGGDRLDNLAKELTSLLPDKITCVKSNPNLLEVFSIDAGKGKAVQELCDILSVDVKDSIAAGDEQNDISMLKAAGLGIAMLNGRDLVKEAADAITDTDNNNDGLVPFLLN